MKIIEDHNFRDIGYPNIRYTISKRLIGYTRKVYVRDRLFQKHWFLTKDAMDMSTTNLHLEVRTP